MAELPFFPLAVDAYLADCSHLEDGEHGRYLLLLMYLWRAPQQRLPNDDEWLARKFRRPVELVKSELRPLIAEFCNCDGNWITQKRLAKEWAYTTKKRKQMTDVAKSRWEKEKRRCVLDTTPHASRNTLILTLTPTQDKKNLTEDSVTAPQACGADERGEAVEPVEPVEPSVADEAGEAGEATAGLRKARAAGRGTRLPDGWQPGPELEQFARELELDPAAVTAEFVDYWCAVSGAKGVKLDWNATYRNRCRELTGRKSVNGTKHVARAGSQVANAAIFGAALHRLRDQGSAGGRDRDRRQEGDEARDVEATVLDAGQGCAGSGEGRD